MKQNPPNNSKTLQQDKLKSKPNENIEHTTQKHTTYIANHKKELSKALRDNIARRRSAQNKNPT